MARRIDINRIIQSQFVSDLPLIIAGCAIAAFATDAFMIPNGLAAGGLTGLATIIAELGRRAGISLPVGLQTIIMNALLLLVVVRSGGLKYVVQTVTGFVLFGFFTDLFAPFVLQVSHSDLMLSALWGGIISGIGYGLVFRCGANTGGSDTIGQIIARKSSLPVGATVMAIDVAVCAASAPVFPSPTHCTPPLPWSSWDMSWMRWSMVATASAPPSSSPMPTRISSTISCMPWTAAAHVSWRRGLGPRRTGPCCSLC